jgi:hypothetical protein
MLALVYWLCTFWPATPTGMSIHKCEMPFGDKTSSVDLLPYVDDEFREQIRDAKGRMLLSPAEFMAIVADGGLEHTDVSKIPKVFHRTSKSRSRVTESMFMEWIASWTKCNPDWLHVLWDDCDIRQLVIEKMPQFLSTFDAYPHQIQRADIFRYVVLQIYGGVYMDLDYRCMGGLVNGDGIDRPDCQAYGVESSNKPVDGELQNSLMVSLSCTAALYAAPVIPTLLRVPHALLCTRLLFLCYL